jgi:hypothetical protein
MAIKHFVQTLVLFFERKNVEKMLEKCETYAKVSDFAG